MNSNHTAFLSTAYLGPIQYYQNLIGHKQVVIEQYDHYIKQTYRNRCNIIGPEGIQSLIIPIVKPSRDKQCMKDILISDHDNWQHLHWQAIKSSYKNSPYYDYFEEEFIKFYTHTPKYLLDFNMGLQETVCELINIKPNVRLSSEYKTDFLENEIDLREAIHPKKELTAEEQGLLSKRYYQVFEQKHQFAPNLSILDLMFNMGPESIFFLDKSYL